MAAIKAFFEQRTLIQGTELEKTMEEAITAIVPAKPGYDITLDKIYQCVPPSEGHCGNKFLQKHGDKQHMVLAMKLANRHTFGVYKTKPWSREATTPRNFEEYEAFDTETYGGYGFTRAHTRADIMIQDQAAILFIIDDRGNVTRMTAATDQSQFQINRNGPLIGTHNSGCIDAFATGRININTIVQLPFNHVNGRKQLQALQQRFSGMTNVQSLEAFTLKYSKTFPKATDRSEEWRQAEWTERILASLKVEVSGFRPYECLGIQQANILLVGQVGAGKSSFFNTLNSIFKGHVTAQAATGSGNHSLTTRLRAYDVRDGRRGNPMGFRFCDTMGLEDKEGLGILDFPHILGGHIPNNHQFNPSAAITKEITGYRANPSLADRMHCVCFVVDACAIQLISQAILDKFIVLRKLAQDQGVPVIVILTKVDRACKLVSADTAKVFHSTNIWKILSEAGDKLGVSKSVILPVKNYEHELELSQKVDILALYAMRQILRYVDNFFDNHLDLVS